MPGEKSRAEERIIGTKVMENGSISKLGCAGPGLGNSIPDRMVSLWSVGSGNYRHHCDGVDGDYHIQVDIGLQLPREK